MLAGTESRENLKYHLMFTRRHKPKDRKTNIYNVLKVQFGLTNVHLGLIKWNGAFRKYWFEPDNNTGWSSDCLDLVSAFLKRLNQRYWKKLRTSRKLYEVKL